MQRLSLVVQASHCFRRLVPPSFVGTAVLSDWQRQLFMNEPTLLAFKSTNVEAARYQASQV